MAVAERLSIDEVAHVLDFGLATAELLVWDDLWTTGAARGDPTAPDLGRRLVQLVDGVRERSDRLPSLMAHARLELNANWPELRAQWMTEEQATVLTEGLAEYGSLGDVAVAFAESFDSILTDEIRSIEEAVEALENGGASAGDFGKWTRVVGGVLIFAAACVATGFLLGAVQAGGAVALASLAALGVQIAYDALKNPQPPPVPAVA